MIRALTGQAALSNAFSNARIMEVPAESLKSEQMAGFSVTLARILKNTL